MSVSNGGSTSELERIFPGDSEMAARMRAFDWAHSDLGPPATWPPNLCMAISLCLTSGFPTLLWWGPNLTVLYNDAYIPFLGETKHPHVVAQPGQVVWREIWDTIEPMLEGVRATGQATGSGDFPFFLARKLPREEVYVRFTYGPILADDGHTVDGIFTPCTETTAQVIGARRLETLRLLGARAAEAQTVPAACQAAAAVLAENPRDMPFAALYVLDEQGIRAPRMATAGVAAETALLPAATALTPDDASPWPLAAALRSGQPAVVDLAALGLALPGGPWPDPATTALVLPIMAAPATPAGVLLAGVSARQPLDDAYRTFFDLVAGHIGTAIAYARAYGEEHKRAAAPARLRRAAFRRDEELRADLANVLESMAEGFMAFDAEWRIIHFNAAAEQDSRTLRAEVLGKNYWEAFPLVIGTRLEQEFRHVMAERIPRRFENHYAPFDQWFEMMVSPVQDGGIAVYGHDVTTLKRAEEALRESEARLRSAMDLARLLPYEWYPQTNALHWDAGLKEIWGLPLDTPVDYELVMAGVHPADRAALDRAITRSSDPAGEGLYTAEYRVINRQTQQERWVAARGKTFFADGVAGRHVGVAQDITEHKRAELELREAAERMRLATEAARIYSWELDLSTNLAKASPNAKDVLGFPFSKEFADNLERVHPEDRELILGRYRGEPAAGTRFASEYRLVNPDSGAIIWVLTHGVFTRDAHGGSKRAIGISQNVTERKRAEEALHESEERYRTLFNTMDEGFVVLEMLFDAAGRPVDFVHLEVNPAYGKLTGLWDGVGKRASGMMARLEESWYALYGNVALTGKPVRTENYAASLDRWFDLYAFRLGGPDSRKVAVLLNDVTERKRAEQALRESEARFRTVADLVPDLLWSRDAQGAEWFNQRWTEYTGQSSTEAAGFGWLDVIHPDDQQLSLANFYRALDSGQPLRHEQRIRGAAGAYRWFRLQVEPVHDEQGRIIRWFVAATDIHEQRLTRNELEERVQRRTDELAAANAEAELQRQRLHDIFMQIPTVVGVLSGPEHRYTLVNPTFLRSMNRRDEDVLGKRIGEVFPEGQEQGWIAVADRVYSSGEPRVAHEALAWLDRQGDGHLEETYWNTVTMPIRNAAGQVEGLMHHAIDMTTQVIGRRRIEGLLRMREEEIARRQEMEEELRVTNEELRALSGQLLAVQEEERRTIARELHDEIGQHLTALRLLLESAGKAIPPPKNSQLANALAVVDDLTARVRELSLDLRPAMLDDLGLAHALLWHTDRYTQQTGIAVILGHQGLEERLPAQVETAVYRIVQEALTNVARHAKTHQATVQILVNAGATVLIEDAGQGFDLGAALARHASTGLSGMRERAERLGGQLIIESAPGGGTRVLAEIPLETFRP